MPCMLYTLNVMLNGAYTIRSATQQIFLIILYRLVGKQNSFCEAG